MKSFSKFDQSRSLLLQQVSLFPFERAALARGNHVSHYLRPISCFLTLLFTASFFVLLLKNMSTSCSRRCFALNKTSSVRCDHRFGCSVEHLFTALSIWSLVHHIEVGKRSHGLLHWLTLFCYKERKKKNL